MSKRFTDTDKWKKPFVKGLQTVYKLFWIYLTDECDHAGIWQVEMDIASVRIGEEIDQEEALQQFGDHIIPIDGGEKWFLPDFITFQYGELNPEVRAHKSVIDRLRKHKLLDENKQFVNPLQRGKDKDKYKDKDIRGSGGNKKTKLELSREFYNSEIEKAKGQKFEVGYSSFVEFIFGKNKTKEPFSQVLSLPKQISYQNFETLMHDYPSQEDKLKIKTKLIAMDNKPGFATKYRELYKTLDNWMKKDY